MTVNHWTDAENKIIRENQHAMSDRKMAALLPGRSPSAITIHRTQGLNIYKQTQTAVPVPKHVKQPVWHGTIPKHSITQEFIEFVERMKRDYGTYNKPIFKPTSEQIAAAVMARATK